MEQLSGLSAKSPFHPSDSSYSFTAVQRRRPNSTVSLCVCFFHFDSFNVGVCVCGGVCVCVWLARGGVHVSEPACVFGCAGVTQCLVGGPVFRLGPQNDLEMSTVAIVSVRPIAAEVAY